jgi:hypothetical protein
MQIVGKKTAKGALFFFATLLGLSPILRTLTLKTSDDTIYALTVCLFIVNMLSHDYSAGPRNVIKYVFCRHHELFQIMVGLIPILFRFPGSLSTNAAIFASVMLASRLQTNMGVFGLTAFAVEWFALFPIFRRHLQVYDKHAGASKNFQQVDKSSFLEHDTGRAYSIVYHNASSFSRLVHSHLESSGVHIYIGN